MGEEAIRIGTKALRLHKSIHDPQFQVRTVLTSDPFDYVDLWLRRGGNQDALFYWRQAHAFRRAAADLSIESAPLVLYYCFMNAAKALLSSRGISFNHHHGVTSHQMRATNGKVVLSNEGIRIKNSGIVPSLVAYFQEQETSKTHSLEDIFYNLVFIHRTYCLSYSRKKERFLPLKDVEFVRDTDTKDVWFRAKPVDDADWKFFRKYLPSEVLEDQSRGKAIISSSKITWNKSNKPSVQEMSSLRRMNKDLRRSIHYINGPQTLWYLKCSGTWSIKRQPITLTLAAMHRLSEICRYRPAELVSFLNGQKNWLLSEFVALAPAQFLDEIACEMTGNQVMIPNVRTPV